MPSRLPRELTDIIIDDLWDNPAALRSCSLVCSAWHKPACKLFFRKITLHSRGLCQALYRLLEESPRINRFIHVLVVTTAGTEEDDWAYVGDIFPRTLRMFTHLRCLTLSNDKFYGQILWSYVSQDCKDAIMDVLQLPSLVSLSLCTWRFDTGIHDVDALLGRGQSLKSLRFEYVSYREQLHPPDASEGEEGPPPGQLELQNLSIEIQQVYRPDILSHFGGTSCPIFNPQSVKTLEITGTKENQEQINFLLNKIGDSLRTLKLVPFDIQPNDDCIDISKNTELRSIQLTFGPVLNARPSETDPIQWLRSFFSSVPANNSLEEIEISLDLKRLLEEWSLYSSGSSLNLDATNWRILRDVLEQDKFRNLQHLSINIHSRWHNTFLYGHLVLQEFQDLGFMVTVSPSGTVEDESTP